MNMTIKQIFDEIASTSGNNAKIEILSKYKENQLLKQVLYMANSKRVKFFIKQIPEYTPNGGHSLEMALIALDALITRKVTGAEATGYLKSVLTSLSSEDAYIIERIIEKDCKIGMGTTFMNKVFKDLIEDTKYMGAKSYDIKLVKKLFEKGKSAYSQLKADGRYAAAIIRGGEAEMESRSGERTVLTNSKLLTELSSFGDDIVLTGELTVNGINSKYSGAAIRTVSNGIIASLIDICSKREERGEVETLNKIAKFEEKHGQDYEKNSITFQEALDSIVYSVWDCVSVDEYYLGKSENPYDKRLDKITNLINNSNSTNIELIESKLVTTLKEAFEHFKEILDRGLEGTILKSVNDGWRDGKPSFCVKLKLEMEVDLVITGFNYGTKGTKNENVISSFNAESSCGKLKTRPQGLTEDKMIYVTENQEKLINTVISVKCNGVSKPKDSEVYALMYPAFLEFRYDEKTVADSIEEILNIEKGAISLASR
jgi:ATP-dependent DNA ligase